MREGPERSTDQERGRERQGRASLPGLEVWHEHAAALPAEPAEEHARGMVREGTKLGTKEELRNNIGQSVPVSFQRGGKVEFGP